MLQFEEGVKTFWLELYRPGYIIESLPKPEERIICIKLSLQSEIIKRFLYVHGDVLISSVDEFINWLKNIANGRSVKHEFNFDPALNFKYHVNHNSKYRFQIELAFLNPYVFEICNFEEYPQDIFVGNEFNLELSINKQILIDGIQALEENIIEEIEKLED